MLPNVLIQKIINYHVQRRLNLYRYELINCPLYKKKVSHVPLDLYIPIQLWMYRDRSLSPSYGLPLLSLLYQNTKILIELNNKI